MSTLRTRGLTRATVSIETLLGASDLGLSLLTAPANHQQYRIAWTATSELVDPTPFLEGTELLLTTGALLDADDTETIEQYAGRLEKRGVQVLGFGVGLRHERTPPALIAHAAQVRIALIEVPLETPFVAITRFVAEAIAEQEYEAVSRSLATHAKLVAALTDREGLPSMITALSDITRSPCCVMDFYGAVLAQAPARASWPNEIIVSRRRETEPWQLDDMFAYPVLLAGQSVATLLFRNPPEGVSPISREVISPAVGLVAIELAKRSDMLHAHRETLGLVLEDVLQGLIAGRVGSERLQRFGIDLSCPSIVLIARTTGPSSALVQLPWNMQIEFDRGSNSRAPLVAICNDEVVVIQAATTDPDDTAKQLADRLRHFLGPVSVGIGNPYPGLEGLRLSHAEASAAVRRGPGINTAGRMRLADLMVASSSLGIHNLAVEILQPLHEYDEATGSELVETLRVFLDEAASTGRTAERMFVHRNTVGQRIKRIRDLTGIDPTYLPHAAELWLTLALERNLR